MASDELAHRQYMIGVLNRRIVQRLENLNRAFAEITGDSGDAALMCACGRDGCLELIKVPLSEYDPVRRSSHRFVVAPGHATEIDTLLASRAGYDVVEIKTQYQLAEPPMEGELLAPTVDREP